MKINPIAEKAIQVQIDGEDYSTADILHKELLAVKHVKFAGVAPPHPLLKTLTLQIHTDGANANDLLKEALENAKKKTDDLHKAALAVFPLIEKRVTPNNTVLASIEDSATSPGPQEGSTQIGA